MLITIPGPQLVDDADNLLTAPVVTIASVTDKLNNAIAGHGAVVNLAGPNVSVDYDAALHGEAWITLAVSQAGATITQQRAAPVIYASRDSSILAANAAALATLPAGVVTALNADPLYSQLVHHLLNKFTYNPATHSLQELLDNGQPLGAAETVTADASGNITSRQ